MSAEGDLVCGDTSLSTGRRRRQAYRSEGGEGARTKEGARRKEERGKYEVGRKRAKCVCLDIVATSAVIVTSA